MQRDLLRELAQLVRFHEPDGRNIGPFVAECAGELAPLLQSHASELTAAARETDGALVDRLHARLDIALEAERVHRERAAAERAERAAIEVGRTARWLDLGAVLDVDLVLGDLLAGRNKHVAFVMPIGEPVIVETGLLRRARILRRTFIDVACFVDEHGLHLRWRGGRGQLNFYFSSPHAQTECEAIIVDLPVQRDRPPVLIRDLLTDLGFVAQ